jgi:hypothetical protein
MVRSGHSALNWAKTFALISGSSGTDSLMAKTRQAITANFDPGYTGKFLPQTMYPFDIKD